MLRARVRAEGGWSNACVLNVSSRGLCIDSGRMAAQGSIVELWHGDHLIVAQVVWSKGTRAGLQAESQVPIEDIVTLSQSPRLQLTAAEWPRTDRRQKPRTHEESRLKSRAIEFASVAVIAASLAATLFSMVEQAFARPLALVQSALGG